MTQKNAVLIKFLSVDNSHRVFLISYLMFMAQNKGMEHFCQQFWRQWIAKLFFSQNQDYSCDLKHRNSYYFNYSFLRAWCVTKPVAIILKIYFFQSLLNETKYYSKATERYWLGLSRLQNHKLPALCMSSAMIQSLLTQYTSPHSQFEQTQTFDEEPDPEQHAWTFFEHGIASN